MVAKKPKKKTPEQAGKALAKLRKDIKDLLKIETPLFLIAANLGQTMKAIRAVIKRFELEDKLLKPELIGQ